MTIDELKVELKREDLDVKQRRKLEIEFHRRWSLSAACLIFALLGVGLGTVTNRRSSRGGGFVICLALLVSYWICYVGAESFARSGWMPAALSLWLVNVLFFAFAIRSLKQSWA